MQLNVLKDEYENLQEKDIPSQIKFVRKLSTPELYK